LGVYIERKDPHSSCYVISRIQKGGLIDRWELSNFVFY
jgi:hypothetical protein